MAYEFADDEPAEDIPTTPEYWHLRAERIFQMMPFMPQFVYHYSVIEDPKTQQLGVDTNDLLPEESGLSFGDASEPIGLMRIDSTDSKIRGYLIDLRYSRKLMQRPLDFDNSVYKDEDPNELHKTVPALGAIFHDPEMECLRLRSKYRDELKHFAVWLMSYIDNERAKRGASVWAHTSPAKKPTSETLGMGVQFSSPSQEAKPDSE